MSIVLFDNKNTKSLYPFTLTKATAALRFGIITIAERWALKTKQEIYIFTQQHLQKLYKTIPSTEHIWVDASVKISDDLIDKILALQSKQSLIDDNGLVACKAIIHPTLFTQENLPLYIDQNTVISTVERLLYPQQMLQWNDEMIREDFKLITKGKKSQPISSTNNVFQQADIFIEHGATVEFATLNSINGPIYIGANATIMEGSLLRGPIAIGESCVLKMGAKIYAATTFGPNCMGGGEIKNSIFQGFSNKAHDGYLGDSIIGEWCNFGAGTSNSNIKNTGGIVQLWNAKEQDFVFATQKFGVLVGDYTRIAINSSINTGSYFGVCCNVFGNGLLPKKIDSFSWGLQEKYKIDKAINDIEHWKIMKGKTISTEEKEIIEYLYHNE